MTTTNEHPQISLLMNRTRSNSAGATAPVNGSVIDPSQPEPTQLLTRLVEQWLTRLEETSEPLPEAYTFLDENVKWVDYPGHRQTTFGSMLRFVASFCNFGRITTTPLVIGAHFLNRVLEKNPDLPFTTRTWKNIFIGCMILATKTYEELKVRLTDFVHPRYFPFLNVESLNELEKNFLKLIGYELEWSLADYTRIILLLQPESSFEKAPLPKKVQHQEKFEFCRH